MMPVIIFKQDGIKTDTINFGKVIPNQTKIITIEMQNIGDVDAYEVELFFQHPDIKIDYPTELKKNEIKNAIIYYAPKLESKGLELKISGIASYEE